MIFFLFPYFEKFFRFSLAITISLKYPLKVIGNRIAEERQKQNLEISDIADQSGLSYNTIAKIENGQDALFSSFIVSEY